MAIALPALPLEPGFALPALPADPPLFMVGLALPAVAAPPADPLLDSEPLLPGEDPALPGEDPALPVGSLLPAAPGETSSGAASGFELQAAVMRRATGEHQRNAHRVIRRL